MHELEPNDFCAIEEYQRFLEQRKRAGDITLGGLYLVLADIRAERAAKEAFKFPVRIKIVDEIGPNFVVVSADLLDSDLQLTGKSRFVMKDGLAIRPEIIERSTKQKVNEMYIKDYEDFGPLGPSEARVEDKIGSTELVVA